MKTDAAGKVALKITGRQEKLNLKNTRRTFSVLQHTTTDKENLVGRSRPEQIGKLSTDIIKQNSSSETGVQTDADDTSTDWTDYPGYEFWRKRAEKLGEDLDNSFREKEELKANYEALQEENRICKAMLEESTTLVEILKEAWSEENPDEEDADKTEEND